MWVSFLSSFAAILQRFDRMWDFRVLHAGLHNLNHDISVFEVLVWDTLGM